MNPWWLIVIVPAAIAVGALGVLLYLAIKISRDRA